MGLFHLKKKFFSLSLLMMVLFPLVEIGQAQQHPQQIFQTGLYREEVEGDLEKAISCFQKIIDNYPNYRLLAANAWLHIGSCCEKLGKEKAHEAYQQILSEFQDQPEVVAIAKERLKNISIRNEPKCTTINGRELTSDIWQSARPFMQWYYDRPGIDITTAYFRHDNWFAHTDWTNDCLYLKNVCSREKNKFINMDSIVESSSFIAVVIIADSRFLPTECELRQNYPNPFNPVTKIEYSLPISANTDLSIYDLQGRKVATLVNTIQKPGVYRAEVDCRALPAGVYLYRFCSDRFEATKKMIIVR